MSYGSHRTIEAASSPRPGRALLQAERDFLVSHSGPGTRALYRLLTLLDRR